MNRKLIVFDWNGTLLSDTRASWLAGNECLKFYGAQPMTLREYREHFTFPIIHFYKKYGLSVDDILAKKEESNAVFHNAYDSLAANARTRSGARQLLNWLQAEGTTSIILSNYVTEKIENHVQRLGLQGYFAHISAHDCNGTTILEKTSKVERLAAFMAKRRYKPEDTIIIGDTTEEPEIARALGLTSIGITDGYISTSRLRKAAPDHIIHTLPEIIPIIKNLGNPDSLC
jgi:phosphoglycolate phosphatase-like HAD superfamily hydrolase